ncbi:DUF4270 family protein [Olivibacter sitiensis]|uniref:DUF4270 family protein n=1 Tax=Olivibacter sitiensis TaxID=376470 RepID=UPI00041C62E9|nr:DUF4270 family protein [Olivibacter sitiensis]
MKYQSRGLLTLLISLFIFNACENPRNVGLDVNPGDEILGTLTDTVTIHSVTQRDAPANTRSSVDSSNLNKPAFTVNQLGLGYINDPVIGETSSDIAFLLQRPTSGDVRLPENAEIDSAILVFNYGRSLFGDSIAAHTLQIRRLAEAFNASSNNFTTSKTWNIEEDLISSKNISRFAIRDSISVVRRINGKDSVLRVPPQLRIALPNNYVKQLFSHELDSTTMNTDASFFSYLKGLYLSVSKEQTTNLGSLATLVANDSTGLEISYKIRHTADSADTVFRRYPANMGLMSMSTKHDYSENVLEQLSNPNGTYTTVYAQGMGGLRTKLSFPYLHLLKDQNLVINKAELVVYIDEDNTGDAKLAPAPRLTLYRQDIARRNQPIPDGDARLQPDPRSLFVLPMYSGSPYAFGGFYDSANKRYTFVMTSFVQDILLGKLNHSDVYLSPAIEYASGLPYFPDANTPFRSVLAGGSNQKFRTKLNIYYSKTHN